jgi:hypothetical protein
MPGQEAFFDLRLWLQIGLTLGGVIATMYVGLVRITARIDSSQTANDLAHKQIVAELKEQNGYIRDHNRELADLRQQIAVERHLGETHRDKVKG